MVESHVFPTPPLPDAMAKMGATRGRGAVAWALAFETLMRKFRRAGEGAGLPI
jgi:hypothetical protein